MTQDNGMDIESPSWQELKEERDALAAHVERCRSLLDDALPNHGAEADHALLCELSDVLEEQAPITSLSRIKAQWQADILDEVGPGFVDIVDRSQARAISTALRRKANSGSTKE